VSEWYVLTLGAVNSSLLAPSYNPCLDFPCDPNVKSCTILSSNFGDKRDRTCGDCRAGYEKQGELCVNIFLDIVSMGPVTGGNIATVLGAVITTLSNGAVSPSNIADTIDVIMVASQV
jgi:hypothetical protein